MACEWNRADCKYEGSSKCISCLLDSQNYSPTEIKQRKSLARVQQKADKRMGSDFEYKNHKNNQALLKSDVTSSMTLNSGATVLQKGDEQITGIIRIMEELKTKVTEQAPGKKTFTIQEKWLSKLHNEAIKENMEFWYLKFSFHEDDNNVYCITEQDIIMSMVKTMIEDRRMAKKAKFEIDLANKKAEQLKAENSALLAKLDYYEKNKEFMDFLNKEKMGNF